MDKKLLRQLANAATSVVSWWPHPKEVRGPYYRWFICQPVDERYTNRVASVEDDVAFAAAAMNNLVPLLDENDRLEARIAELESMPMDKSFIEAMEKSSDEHGLDGSPTGRDAFFAGAKAAYKYLEARLKHLQAEVDDLTYKLALTEIELNHAQQEADHEARRQGKA